MDTNKIKRFATEARNILKAGIKAKIITLGFDKNGNVPEQFRPQLMQGGSLWNGQLQTEGFYHQWMSLYNRVQQKGINEVYEEAAYTWFNRLCAIRILQKNKLCEPVMVYADSARTPKIVDDARQGHLLPMKEEVRQRLMELLDDDTKVTEQFAILITAWCHANPIINQCFGGMADYTELLLPNNILAENGFVDKLNHTEFIADEDFQSPELIGWLYQFYISERKDEVFAKKGKFEADEIPAATQIFTPNWIVKYMVQNTVGRIYLDNNPASKLKNNWKYLVPNDDVETQNIASLTYDELTDLKVADLACGSGHILNECFDLLYDLYIAEGYGRAEAVENIFAHNLTGIDLDTRAKQLATFALLLKACQKDASFADAHILPKVLAMPKAWNVAEDGDVKVFLHTYFQGEENSMAVKELTECFELMKDADSLGSIMKFNISDSTRLLVKQTTAYWCSRNIVPEAISAQIPAFQLILALTEKYHALVMNPPYMGGGNMNEVLSKYVKDNYEEGKADLCTTFMMMQSDNVVEKGFYANIIPPSWMFLSTFEALRKDLIETQSIQSVLHLSRGVFGADFGAVASVIKNEKNENAKGTYFRLVERTFQEFEQDHLRILFEKTLENPDFKFYFKDYTKDDPKLYHSDNGNKIFYPNVSQKNFEKIPGCPIGYWLGQNWSHIFTDAPSLSTDYDFKKGMSTGDNNRFIRNWSEVLLRNINFTCKTEEESQSSDFKWYPINCGGTFRKWYGNQDCVVNWQHNGSEMKANAVILNHGGHWSRYITSVDRFFIPGLSWNAISSGDICVRKYGCGFLFCSASMCGFGEDLDSVIALLNSKVAMTILKVLAPTMNYGPLQVKKIPFLTKRLLISGITEKNISISRQDWDAHETSWDFQKSELLAIIDGDVVMENVDFEIEQYRKKTGKNLFIDPAWEPGSLEWRYAVYCGKWERLFYQLHENEEELNRQFIEIYGLQDELTPDVPLEEITILQQGEISIVDKATYTVGEDEPEPFSIGDKIILWNADVVMKQFISYAVGCMLGRYRLDKPGLHIAHPEPTAEEIAPYSYNGGQFNIDDDGIMPLMSNDCGFSDNAAFRFSDFIRLVFGDEEHVENLNFVEQKLGKTVEQYFVKDFWKDHKKMYQNRPIYWLFSSKKGAFQVIAYMHRMNAYTAERIRAKYLLPYIEHLQNEINQLDLRRAELSTKETKALQNFQKQLEECREYHDRLQVVAEQAIAFDLDDGVVVNYEKFGDVVARIK